MSRPPSTAAPRRPPPILSRPSRFSRTRPASLLCGISGDNSLTATAPALSRHLLRTGHDVAVGHLDAEPGKQPVALHLIQTTRRKRREIVAGRPHRCGRHCRRPAAARSSPGRRAQRRRRPRGCETRQPRPPPAGDAPPSASGATKTAIGLRRTSTVSTVSATNAGRNREVDPITATTTSQWSDATNSAITAGELALGPRHRQVVSGESDTSIPLAASLARIAGSGGTTLSPSRPSRSTTIAAAPPAPVSTATRRPRGGRRPRISRGNSTSPSSVSTRMMPCAAEKSIGKLVAPQHRAGM